MAEPRLNILRDREIVVGVTGGIAAYKAATLVSRLDQCGARPTVVMTEAAKRFIGEPTLMALSGRPVYSELFVSAGGWRAEHVGLADRADLVAVVPATANILGKLAHGIADDLLSTFLLAIDVPLVMAPAMNDRMWNHPAVQANCRTLAERGVRLVGPVEGHLACGKTGGGRMADPETILAEIADTLTDTTGRNRD